MADPVVIYDSFSAVVPAGTSTSTVSVRFADDMYLSWLISSSSGPDRDHYQPWYVATGTASANGLLLTTTGIEITQMTLTNSAIATTFKNGGPAETSIRQTFFFPGGNNGLTFHIKNPTAVDISITDLTLTAITRPNYTGLPDYTTDWSGVPPEIFGDPSITEYLNIGYTLPSSGDAVDLIVPENGAGGIGPAPALVTAYPLPTPVPEVGLSSFIGIENPYDINAVGFVSAGYWDIDQQWISFGNYTNPGFPDPGLLFLVIPDAAVYWTMFAFVTEPVDGAGNIVPPDVCTLHIDFYVPHPINLLSPAYGAISFAGFVTVPGTLGNRGRRAFAQVVG